MRSAVAGATTIDVGIARQADMADVELALRIEQIGIGAFARQRADRKRRDEMLRGCGENERTCAPRSCRRRMRSSDL